MLPGILDSVEPVQLLPLQVISIWCMLRQEASAVRGDILAIACGLGVPLIMLVFMYQVSILETP